MPEILMRRRAVLAAGLGLAGVAATAGAAVWLTRSESDRVAADGPAELRLATGPAGGVYRAIGGELVKVLAERFPRSRVIELPTGASVDNLALLAAGDTELALAYLDATVAGLAAHKPDDVTAVARLYDAWMHVIVLASSPVETFLDLHDRVVTAGAAGSGTRFTTDRLIELAAIRPSVIINASQADGADLLAGGQVDAMLSLTGMPTPAVIKLANVAPLRLIPLDTYAVAMEKHYGSFYTPAVLPSSVYPGIDATDTLTTPNLLLSRPDLPASVIAAVTDALFAERARIARGHPDANRINVRTAIATAPVRLHPGAVSYFRSVKP